MKNYLKNFFPSTLICKNAKKALKSCKRLLFKTLVKLEIQEDEQ